jgi:selenide,water dikinase
MRDAAVEVMTQLNDVASVAARAAGVTALTDVTGYGLLGHLHEMLGPVGAVIDAAAVPLIDGATDLAIQGVVPGGSKRNLAHAREFTDFGAVDDSMQILLSDAQTSGGLLMAIPPGEVEGLLMELTQARRIGELTADRGVIVR